ncbi:MAG: hypothetical protein DRO14_05645 [Thermoprotei archaeon]|nr:MAG: hypothetical protein DRO14_05645 [Thermoprotei archaeon]
MMPKLAFLTILAALMIAATIPAAAETVPLNWRDSGYDLAAGYRYTIALESPVSGPFVYPYAIVDAGPVRIRLHGPQLTIWVNGEPVFDESVGSTSASVVIVVDYSGDGVIEVTGFGRVAGFTIDHSYRIMIYTETVTVWPWSSTSRVVITRQALPPPPTSTTTNPNLEPMDEDINNQMQSSGLWNWLATAFSSGAMIAIVFLVIAFGIIVILMFLKQARKRKWL